MLICPSDDYSSVSVATNWSLFGISSNPGFSPGYVELFYTAGGKSIHFYSYFIGGDAMSTMPQSILGGDHNIYSSDALSGMSAATKASQYMAVAPSDGDGGNGLYSAWSLQGFRFDTWVWLDTVHRNAGNLLMGDGRAVQASQNDLTSALNVSTTVTATGRFPFYNFPGDNSIE